MDKIFKERTQEELLKALCVDFHMNEECRPALCIMHPPMELMSLPFHEHHIPPMLGIPEKKMDLDELMNLALETRPEDVQVWFGNSVMSGLDYLKDLEASKPKK
jgi:hypothetical protein